MQKKKKAQKPNYSQQAQLKKGTIKCHCKTHCRTKEKNRNMNTKFFRNTFQKIIIKYQKHT